MTQQFTSDIFKFFFINSHDAQYIADLATGRILMANLQFSTMTGYTQQDIAAGSARTWDLIPEADLEDYKSRLQQRRPNVPESYVLKIRTKKEEMRVLEFTVVVVEHDKQMLTVGSCRDVTEREKLQDRLQQENKRFKHLTYETARANVRIYQLTEKIGRVPQLLGDLISTTTEEELFKRAAETLTDPQGLKYENVVFLMIENDELAVKHCAKPVDFGRFSLRKDHLFARAARGERYEMPADAEFYLQPIAGYNAILGVVVVYFDPQEKILFDEINQIKTSQENLVRTLAQAIGLQLQNIRLFDQVRQQSITDQTTGIFNRRYFDSKLRDEVQRAIRYGRELSLLHIDMDGFKQVNDTLGHQQGDIVLAESATIFRQVSREIDIVCRYGGDEFVLILPETGAREAAVVSDKILNAVRNHAFTTLNPSGPKPAITLSIGIAATNAGLDDDHKLLRAADAAMYEAKFSGKNRFVIARENIADMQQPGGPAKPETPKPK